MEGSFVRQPWGAPRTNKFVDLPRPCGSPLRGNFAVFLRQLLLELLAGGLDQRRGQRLGEFDLRLAFRASGGWLSHTHPRTFIAVMISSQSPKRIFMPVFRHPHVCLADVGVFLHQVIKTFVPFRFRIGGLQQIFDNDQ